MQSLAQLRKCVYPFPVYEATFEDGSTGRLSIWQPFGKPWTWDRHRRVMAQCFRKPVVSGVIHHDGATEPDPMGAEAKPARVNSKQMVRELLKMIEGGYWSPEAYAQARRWAA